MYDHVGCDRMLMQPRTFVRCLNSFMPFHLPNVVGYYSDVTIIHDTSAIMSSILQLILISAVCAN